MKDEPAFCSECPNVPKLVWSVLGNYQCPVCNKFWDGKFPITMTNQVTVL